MLIGRVLADVRRAGRRLAATAVLVRRSMALVMAAAPRHATLIVALMVAEAALPVGTLWASRSVVDAAAHAAGLTGPASVGGGTALAVWIGVAVGLVVAQRLLVPLLQTAQGEAADLVTAHVNGALIAAANRWRGLARFEDPALANDLALARRHAAASPASLVGYGGQVAQALVTIVAMAAALWRLHPAAPLLLVLAAVPRALQENVFAQYMANEYESASADARRADTYRAAVLDPGPAKDVRLLGLGDFFLGRYGAVFGRMQADVWTLRRRLLGRMLPAQALSGALVAATYLYAVRRVLGGGAGLGDLVFYGGALLQLEGALTAGGYYAGLCAMALDWLPSLFRVLDAGPDLPEPPAGRALPAPRPIRAGLVLEHVAFRYPGASADAVRDVSFAVRPGERLALVGKNGAGKTTLVKLLARLYDPTAGRITLDGVDLRDYDLADLRRQIGVIFQDFVRYQLTARENLGLGDVAHLDDAERVRAAAEQGGATGLLGRLPQGLDTMLGSRFGGVELSGGEWQTIALARACMRRAQVLILDEPTAALDVRAEHAVYRRFAELTADATTVLVSHRFSTVRLADHIVYLEDGRLAEEGGHDALLARGGGYARLYGLQAALYRDEQAGD